MKKLLELLGIILITSNATGPLVANKPNNNSDKIKNNLETLTRPKRQAPKKQEKGKDNKKAKQQKSSTPKPQNEQVGHSSVNTADQIEIIDKLKKKDIILTLDSSYSGSITNMLNGLIDENHLSRLRSLNMGGLISTLDNREPLIKIIEKLNKKMANLLDEQENNNEKVLILTLKKKKEENKDNDEDKEIKLVIRLENFYVLGFINKYKDDKEQYFYFKDSKEKIKEINDSKKQITELGERTKQNATKHDQLQKKLAKAKINQEINKAVIEQYNFQENNFNLDYTADYNEEGLDVIIRGGKDTGKDIDIFQKTLNEAVEHLVKVNNYNKQNQTTKEDLVRIIFITSEAMRFQCDEKTLELYAEFKNDKELTEDEIKKLNEEKQGQEQNKIDFKKLLKTIIEEKLGKKSNIIQLIKNDNCDQARNEINNTKLSNNDKQTINERIKEIEKITEEIAEIKDKIEIAELNKIIKKSKNIPAHVQEVIDAPTKSINKSINWKDYTTQLRSDGKEFGGWKDYSETLNKFRIKIWEELIKAQIFIDFIYNNQNLINEVLKGTENEEEKINKIDKIIDKPENAKYKEIKDVILLFIINRKDLTKLVTEEVWNINTKNFSDFFKNLNKLNIDKNNDVSLLFYCIVQKNLDIIKFLIRTEPKIINDYWNNYNPLEFSIMFYNQDIIKFLIDNGADLNATNKKNGNTVLHTAIMSGYTEIVELLFKHGANNINKANNNKWTPLYLAALVGRTEIVQLLLDYGADVNASEEEGDTPLHAATTLFDNNEIIRILLNHPNSGIDINIKGKDKVTPLYLAVKNNHVKALKVLLEHKADVNIPDKNVLSPLHVASAKGNIEIVKLLLANGANINAPDKEDNIPLHLAAQEGNPEVIKLLLDYGADVNAKNKEGNTSLHSAADKGHLNVVQLLLVKTKELYKNDNKKFKEFINQANNELSTALHIAVWNNNFTVVKKLLNHPETDINKINEDNLSPLHGALAKSNIEIVKLLLANGANINAPDKEGNTPLHFAAQEGNPEVIKLLFDKARKLYNDEEFKKFINATNKKGNTSLCWASDNGHIKIVKLLINKSRKLYNDKEFKMLINHQDKANNTPLHWATKKGYLGVVKLLLANDADVKTIYGHEKVQNLLKEFNRLSELKTKAKTSKKQKEYKDKLKDLLKIELSDVVGKTKLEEISDKQEQTILNRVRELNFDLDIDQVKVQKNSITDTAATIETIDQSVYSNGAVKVIFTLAKKASKPSKTQKTITKDESGFGELKRVFLNSAPKSSSNINTNSDGSQTQGGSGTQNQTTRKVTNHNNLYDVPADNSCLFWSVATSYLLPTRNNNEEFRNRFIQLFGELQLSYLSYVQTLLQQFNLSNTNNFLQDWYQDATAHRLVRVAFRNRVVNYIERNLDNPTQSNANQTESFRSAIQISENEVVNNYLDRMRNINAWGGEIEILAMNNLLNANISVNNNGSYQPVNQNSNNNNIAISYVELTKGSGIHNHYNFALTPEENRTNHPIAINDNQGNIPVVDTTKRPDNLPPTTPKSDTKSIKLPVDDHAQHHTILSNNNEDDDANQGNIINAPEPTTTPLQKDEYHFVDKKTEEKSLKNDENLEINLIKNNNKIKQNVPVVNKPINKNIINAQIIATKAINKYNTLSKEEKLKKLNEINRYYQTLPENDKKAFKEKLTNTGLAALSGGALTAYGTKMTVSGTAATSVTNAEAMEMTPLLSTNTTESLAAAETITVAETAAVEGGVIAGETGTAAALAPETLGLSLVIGGLAIAGTWMYFAFHHHATSDIALPTSIHHNVYDNIEKWYKFLAHDKLKIKINKTTWNEIKQNKNSPANIIKIIKNKFVINDHSGWGGSVTNEDFNTLVKAILLHFEQINGYFEILDNENDGFVIITNTEGDWLGIE